MCLVIEKTIVSVVFSVLSNIFSYLTSVLSIVTLMKEAGSKRKKIEYMLTLR